MLGRYNESLRVAADRARQFTTEKESSKPQLFIDFVEGLKVAAGSAHQLSMARMDTRWLDIRDCLEKILDLGKSMPPTKGDDSQMWIRIETTLLQMADNGIKLSNMKSQSRVETLVNLNNREIKARAESQTNG